MWKFTIGLTAALFLFALTGCATPPPAHIEKDALSHIKRFGTISMVADTLARQYVGYTAFGNEKEEKDISPWDIDKLYEEQLKSAVQAVLDAKYVPGTHTPAAFKQVNDLNGPWDAPAYWGPNWSHIEAPAKAYCQENSLDALFVVAKQKTGDVFSDSNQHLDALGTYFRSNNGISVIYLSADVALIDCTSGKPLAVRYLKRPPDTRIEPTNAIAKTVMFFARPLEPNKSTGPMKSLLPDISKKPISEWSESEQALIKQELIDLPSLAWAETLRSMLPNNK